MILFIRERECENKDIKPFVNEFYNSFNLTNLHWGIRNWMGRTFWGQLSGGRGVIVLETIGTGGNCPGVIVWVVIGMGD